MATCSATAAPISDAATASAAAKLINEHVDVAFKRISRCVEDDATDRQRRGERFAKVLRWVRERRYQSLVIRYEVDRVTVIRRSTARRAFTLGLRAIRRCRPAAISPTSGTEMRMSITP